MADLSDSRRRLLIGGGLAAMATGALASRADAAPGTAPWILGGNTNISAANFLGVQNVAPLVFKTSATANTPLERMRIQPDGRVGIGTTAPTGLLTVQTTGGTAIRGRLTNKSSANVGVEGSTAKGIGVRGESTDTSTGTGVLGTGVIGVRAIGSQYGVYAGNGPIGVYGGGSDYGVLGSTSGTAGVSGSATGASSSGVEGRAFAAGAAGVFGVNTTGPGVWGRGTNSGSGVYAESTGGRAVLARVTSGIAVEARGGTGVAAGGMLANGWIGVQGEATGAADSQGVRGEDGHNGTGTTNWAGVFNGRVFVGGTLVKPAGTFKIDHPLDPTGKYLSHSFVESPDMKNVYDGVATLDGQGKARVELPAYFQALNRDFRYQLTCLGAHAPVYVAEKVSGNGFTIAGGEPGMEVSWQVTGIRKDAYAKANPITVEEEKPPAERGRYLHPHVFGKGVDQGVGVRRGLSS